MKVVYLKNFRRGLATNSSSTHSLIYRNEGELFKDLDIFELDYYDRYTKTIAASREAKIKYVLTQIMYNEGLVKIMSAIYPEMEQYFPKIKIEMEKEDDTFGSYCRGGLEIEDNIEASVDYLRKIIDDPDIIIIGGSDEDEFVYETESGHEQMTNSDQYGRYSKFGMWKNGNYWVGFGSTDDHIVVRDDDACEDNEYINPTRHCFGGKIRFTTNKDVSLVPEYPELIDLRITNQCDHGCKFCFMDSNMKEKHANLNFLYSVIAACSSDHQRKVEFSIGGGNILLYPHLEKLFRYIHERGHILNVTINALDCKKVLEEPFKDIFVNYVDGIGVSVTNIEDAKLLVDFESKYREIKNYDAYIVAHIIPEYIGIEMTHKINDYFIESKSYIPSLYLGYKTNGRGASQNYKCFTEKDLNDLFKKFHFVSIDTTFSNRYFWWIKNNFSYKKTITMNEGEFSMYIDGVTENAYKSSYQLDKPYNMHVDYGNYSKKCYSLKDAFSNIRKDSGFHTYESSVKHYWDFHQ